MSSSDAVAVGSPEMEGINTFLFVYMCTEVD